MMNVKMGTKNKILVLAAMVALTLGIHHGFILEPIFGHSDWVHAIHGRFCYIPIAMAAVWFGIKGGLLAATVISVLILPYILGGWHPISYSSEIVEIIFYFAIAVLTGALIDRELWIRKKHQETRLQLERSHKLSLVGQMAAGVAHEIKNPLASIKGAVEILADSKTSDTDKKEFSKIVTGEIKRVDSTIKEFLDFARPKETELEKLNLSETLISSIKQLEHQMEKSGISVQSNIQENIFIKGDAEKIHQVFLNLLLNAIDASEKESRIMIDLKDTKYTARVTISDTGKGVGKDDLEKIFDPFFTTKSTGTGLGLAIVKLIIENHNGGIHISSSHGLGTEVTLEFPIYKE